MKPVYQDKVAAVYGAVAALFIERLRFWQKKSRTVHAHRKWVCGTYDYWSQQVGCSRRTMARIIQRLSKDGVLLKDDFNLTPLSHTAWYSIDENQLFMIFDKHTLRQCQNGTIDSAKMALPIYIDNPNGLSIPTSVRNLHHQRTAFAGREPMPKLPLQTAEEIKKMLEDPKVIEIPKNPAQLIYLWRKLCAREFDDMRNPPEPTGKDRGMVRQIQLRSNGRAGWIFTKVIPRWADAAEDVAAKAGVKPPLRPSLPFVLKHVGFMVEWCQGVKSTAQGNKSIQDLLKNDLGA